VYLIWNIILHDRHLSFSVAWALEFGTVRGNGRPRVHGTSGTPLATPLLARSPPRWLRRRHLDKHSICTAVRATRIRSLLITLLFADVVATIYHHGGRPRRPRHAHDAPALYRGTYRVP